MSRPSAQNGERQRLPTLDECLTRKTRPPVDLFCFYVRIVSDPSPPLAETQPVLTTCCPSIHHRFSCNEKDRRTSSTSGSTFTNTRTSAGPTSRYVLFASDAARGEGLKPTSQPRPPRPTLADPRPFLSHSCLLHRQTGHPQVWQVARCRMASVLGPRPHPRLVLRHRRRHHAKDPRVLPPPGPTALLGRRTRSTEQRRRPAVRE